MIDLKGLSTELKNDLRVEVIATEENGILTAEGLRVRTGDLKIEGRVTQVDPENKTIYGEVIS